MNVVDLILSKRDGGRLGDDEIDWLFDAYLREEVAEEQMAALLMAIFFRGMEPAELARWTERMMASGERVDLAGLGAPTVDKHSTGGVGDKVSLILCPLVAACGAFVPQTAGRGIGHTGGTLDKLETIPGWRAQLSNAEALATLRSCGAHIRGAGPELVPADRRLYALRDVTGTVAAVPLIASSIMSKKIAEGTSALVLDVKVGTGAFMTTLDQARELATTMVGLGTAHGVRTTALLTDMSTPLGRSAGNALEVAEAVEVLAGGGPSDLVELTIALALEMLQLVDIDDVDPAEVLASGRALESWDAMIRAQDGDPEAPIPVSNEIEVLRAPASGVLARLDAMAVGQAAWRLGAGRSRKEDEVSPVAGVAWHATVGDDVTEGQPLLELHVDDVARLPAALESLEGAYDIVDGPVAARPLILDRIG